MPYAGVDEGESRDFHVHDCHAASACPARGPSEDYVALVGRGERTRGSTAGDGVRPRDDNHVATEVDPAAGKMMSVNGSVCRSQRCEEGGVDSELESVSGGVGAQDEIGQEGAGRGVEVGGSPGQKRSCDETCAPQTWCGREECRAQWDYRRLGLDGRLGQGRRERFQKHECSPVCCGH